MFFSLDDYQLFLEHYKYLLIFPIVILEGPIITVICGFLVYLGKLDATLTIPLLIVGDLIGDTWHYLLGRVWKNAKWFKKVAGFFGYNDEKEKIVEEHFKKHSGKTLIMGKVAHGVGGFVQIVAGIAKMDFGKFLYFSALGTVPKTTALFFLGYYLGSSYLKIDSYMDYVAYFSILVFLAVTSYFLVKNKLKEKFVEKKY
jgi:membrane-associated protein